LDTTEAPIRWGILGTGDVASTFAQDLQLLDDASLVAVGSRSQWSADAFGDRLGIRRRYGTYVDLVTDPDVDVVYVATPPSVHHEATLMALRASKPVLCEKPFMINAAEADEVIAVARQQNLFLMEAMWTRFLPHMVRIRELLASGLLGDVRILTADHGQRFVADARHRLFAPQLGGGALLDLGIYPISFASLVLGSPRRITAVSDPTGTGVDATTSMLFQYAEGQHAVLTATLEARSSNRASIVGSDARIEIDSTWFAPTSFTLIRPGPGRDVERFEAPQVGRGLHHQAVEVARCLRTGLTESNRMPLDESASIMATLDEVRRQIRLRFPGE
jgi:predicted dehydrogenase